MDLFRIYMDTFKIQMDTFKRIFIKFQIRDCLKNDLC